MRPIDADFLIDYIKPQLGTGDALFDEVMKKIIGILEATPTIDAVSVVHGEWIVLDRYTTAIPVYWSEEQKKADKRGAGINEHCECSACGWRTTFSGWRKIGVEKPFNYCPNCGAKMKGADDE